MKVKLISMYAGPEGCFQPGAEIEVEKKEGKALVSGGYAVSLEVEEEKPTKKGKGKAVVEVPEDTSALEFVEEEAVVEVPENTSNFEPVEEEIVEG